MARPPAAPAPAALALALALALLLAPHAARAADPSVPAAGGAPAIAAPRPDRADVLPPHEAARAAAEAALKRSAPLQASAFPPHYANYSLANSRDTFEICKNQSGLAREIGLEELLPIYGLPRELLQHRRVNLATLSRVFAAAAPAARLVIAPLLAGEAELSAALHQDGRLPRLVHFTVRDKDALLPHQALSIATWARLNPGYSILLYDDDDIAAFMAAYHAHHLPLFHRLGSQVERTDLWRYLVLCTFGGVYADSDVVAGRPISDWAQDAGLLTGVENVFESLAAARRRDYTRVMQIVQWTIAARPGHPVVCRMGDYVAAHVEAEAAGSLVEEDRDHAILERTGPGIWSSSVHDYLRQHGVTPEDLVGGGRVGDVRLLPQSVFGCASSTVNLSDPMAWAYHMFKGSWRLHEPGKLLQFISHLYAHLFNSGGANGGAGASPAPAALLEEQGQGQEQEQRRQQQALGRRQLGGGPEEAEAKSGSGSGGGSSSGEVAERRLQQDGAGGSGGLQLQLQPLDAAAPAGGARRRLSLLPAASGLVVAAAVIVGAVAQRGGGKCAGGGGGSGRPCGGLRSSATGALSRVWGGARRLTAGSRAPSVASLSAAGATAALLPLSQPGKGAPGAERPPSGGGGGSGGGCAAASTATRQQGSNGAGVLKRSANSTQCLQSMQ
ncbi:alpha-1,6-mannosyltransferase subunit [Raphidocelis subcapitata]|uniref:Alpha-1,6-mannosyltransferase subunit n=1 Tax=Raphidocelis subcapitata TaxID=307507 RepID=A0A2V0P903_9CHLO|nr:alpha-1,6-mannosyltransferase subunit [Raphidocelis subcapitata]|eukprot:GBF96338.1 alpha-1,6-mannosyltransferase subunit [Raphidocelis subcapitata]